MHVAILGGGGNVAEAVTSLLVECGHKVSHFRYKTPVNIPGIPPRPPRQLSRLESTNIRNVSSQVASSSNVQYHWIELDSMASVDAFIFSFPSFMMSPLVDMAGQHFAGKPFINLSDRFLGTYSGLRRLFDKFGGMSALPSIAVAFNGVPVMAIRDSRDGNTMIYCAKSSHSIACYPNSASRDAASLLGLLFQIKETQLRIYPSMLDLAFENAHCVEHAVADLRNLKAEKYRPRSILYSKELYTEAIVKHISDIVKDRDAISSAIIGSKFSSLRDYDIRMFGGQHEHLLEKAGTPDFRIEHRGLSNAPAPQPWSAFGYEDIGWSLVTLESFGRAFGVTHTVCLTNLIDEWSLYMNCDYRAVGRTIRSLGLLEGLTRDTFDGPVTMLNWLPDTLPINPGIESIPSVLENPLEPYRKPEADVVATRVFNHSRLLQHQLVGRVRDEFTSVVPRIFEKNLAFAFIFGGFAKGYAVSTQDADFFVCVYEEDVDQVTRLREWYFEIHSRYGLAPDLEVPCSFTTLSHLREKLDFARAIRLRTVIPSAYEKQSIVWTDILTGAKIGKIGNLELLNDIEDTCSLMPQKWRKELVDLLDNKEDPETAKLPLSRLFRRIVVYQKQGDVMQMPRSNL